MYWKQCFSSKNVVFKHCEEFVKRKEFVETMKLEQNDKLSEIKTILFLSNNPDFNECKKYVKKIYETIKKYW